MSGDRINDGGPAYPVPAVFDPSRDQVHSSAAFTGESGMSLRDYFASDAMKAMIATAGAPCLLGLDGCELDTARAAYRMADAMLKARSS